MIDLRDRVGSPKCLECREVKLARPLRRNANVRCDRAQGAVLEVVVADEAAPALTEAVDDGTEAGGFFMRYDDGFDVARSGNEVVASMRRPSRISR
jgi:hypothetical protein